MIAHPNPDICTSNGQTRLTHTRTLGVITLMMLTIALLLNLGLRPLRLEEPRRALIALEMIYSGDFLVPTEFGEPYFNKPPLWNWVVVAAYRLFGGYTEFAVRFFSPVSLLAIGGVMYLLGRRYLDERQATIAALLFLVCGDLLFYFSLIGEIDLFYALLTFAAFAALFHFYQQGSYWTAFALFYLLNGLGALTKGLPSLAFASISVAVLLLYRRDLGRLFSIQHMAAVVLFAVMVGGYFLMYASAHPVDGYLLKLWGEASTRTLSAEGNFDRLLVHLLTFPLDTLKATLPAALLAPFLFHRRFAGLMRGNPLIEFYVWVGVANFALYWISPGSAQRYIYALYPPLVAVLVWFYQHVTANAPRRTRVFDGLTLLILALGAVAIAALPFVPEFSAAPYFLPVSIGGLLLASGLLALAWKRPQLRLWSLIWLGVLLRLVMDLTIIPYDAQEGGAQAMRQTALEIARRSSGEPVRLYRGTTCSRTIVFYLERASGQVVRRSDDPAPGKLVITARDRLGSEPHQTLYRFTDDEGGEYLLVRFRNKASVTSGTIPTQPPGPGT